MRGPLRQLGEPQRQVGGILGAKYETGLRLKGVSFRVKWVKIGLGWDNLKLNQAILTLQWAKWKLIHQF